MIISLRKEGKRKERGRERGKEEEKQGGRESEGRREKGRKWRYFNFVSSSVHEYRRIQ